MTGIFNAELMGALLRRRKEGAGTGWRSTGMTSPCSLCLMFLFIKLISPSKQIPATTVSCSPYVVLLPSCRPTVFDLISPFPARRPPSSLPSPSPRLYPCPSSARHLPLVSPLRAGPDVHQGGQQPREEEARRRRHGGQRDGSLGGRRSSTRWNWECGSR